MNPRRMRAEHGLGVPTRQMNQAETSGRALEPPIVTIAEPITADRKTLRFARPNSFVGEKTYPMPVSKSPVNVPYATTDSSPQTAPSSAPLVYTSPHSVSRTGMTVAAASKSANRNISNTPSVSKVNPPIVGFVAR